MTNKRLGWLAGGLLAVGLGLGTVAVAGAGQKAPSREDRDAPNNKAQSGGACKVDADCDQSDGAMKCEKNKCKLAPSEAPRHPPPVT